MQEYKDILEKFHKYFANETFSQEIETAKTEYFERVGRVYEDDSFFEPRMAAFFEWFSFERPAKKIGLVPFEIYLKSNEKSFEDVEKDDIQRLLKSVWSLFLVKKQRGNDYKLIDLFDNKKYEAQSDREIYLAKSKIIEARLIESGSGGYYLSENLFTHPLEVTKAIKKQVKKLKLTSRKEFHDFIFDLTKKSIKTHRYKHISLEEIYKFD